MQKVYEVQITGKFIFDEAICGYDSPDRWGAEDLIAAITNGMEPDVVLYELETRRKEAPSPDPGEEPELKAGPDTGSKLKCRPWRHRHDQHGGLEKEYIYRGTDYIRVAERLGVGSHDKETRVVWLTESEIESVREACYEARLARGLTTGVPRSRLNGLGGE